MTHEEFIEKYASLLEKDDFIQVQVKRGSGELDDDQYIEKLISFGVSVKDAIGYTESDKQLSKMLEESGMFDDLEAITILMVNDLSDTDALKKSTAADSSSLRSKLISENNLSSEEADKVIAYLLKPEN
jgi:hypothetical protein